jgi:chemotaxis protein CheD
MENFVKMSEICVVNDASTLKTVVGSCIALCLWDGQSRIGGMAHIMMPVRNGDAGAPPGKYADTAVQALLAEMVKRGASIDRLTATCAGGASMFVFRAAEKQSVGDRNYDAVVTYLNLHRIPIRIREIGGTAGRRIHFDCSNGMICISTLMKSSIFNNQA